jgi:hypothetical protein
MPTRRVFLGCTVTTALAGCVDSERGLETQTPNQETTAEESPAETATLDLTEANVTSVGISPDGSTYDFSVELYHDDDGEEGYANWWQVETLDGDRLGRRELLHPHSTAPFTRSKTIEIPEEISCVVVRGHDQTHGYGGQAILVSLPDGTTRAVKQGSDPQSFSESACP